MALTRFTAYHAFTLSLFELRQRWQMLQSEVASMKDLLNPYLTTIVIFVGKMIQPVSDVMFWAVVTGT